jgi:hypothetical protein
MPLHFPYYGTIMANCPGCDKIISDYIRACSEDLRTFHMAGTPGGFHIGYGEPPGAFF